VLEEPGLDALIDERRAEAQAAALRVAQVGAAQADSERTADDLARGETLRAEAIISPEQYDALRSAALGAAARLAAARAAVGDAAAANAALALARATRDELTLLAPEDGVILTRFVDRGEVLGVGSPVVSLGLVRRPYVRAYVAERWIGRLRVGLAAVVHIDAYPATRFAGRISEIEPQAEFTPRVALTERERADLMFGIKVTPDSADAGGRIKAGMPVTLDLTLLP